MLHLKNFFHRNFEWILFAVGVVVMHLIFFSSAFRGPKITREAAGQFGDFIGGYFGTFFALGSVLLLVRTLKHQSQASRHEKFEAKYFQLVRLHRENVAEMELQTIHGRNVFVRLIREFRSILEVAKRVAQRRQLRLTQEELIVIAYHCLFFGAGANASRMLKESLLPFDQAFVNELELELRSPEIRAAAKLQGNLPYEPFHGHQSRLGHYYRHLYQTVCYVDRHPISVQNQYDYVKIIRAQLSTHELAFLFMNSLSPMGSRWRTEGLIEKYRLVQNLPLNFFDPETEIDLKDYFQEVYFESYELRQDSREKRARR